MPDHATFWTDERREEWRQRMHRVRPWERSTGARTAKGKARSSMNALKHGFHCAAALQLRRACRDVATAMRDEADRSLEN